MRKIAKTFSKLFVFALILSMLIPVVASAATTTAPAGYHMGNYHNSGNWTEWGVTLPTCDNCQKDTGHRQCVHYLERQILSATAKGPDGRHSDAQGLHSTWGKIPTSIDDPRWEETYSLNGSYIMRCHKTSTSVVRKGSAGISAAFENTVYCMITTDNQIWCVYPEWQCMTATGSWAIAATDKQAAYNQVTAEKPSGWDIVTPGTPWLGFSEIKMSLFSVKTLSACGSEEEGKYIKGAAFYYWGSPERYYQNGVDIGLKTDSYGGDVDGSRCVSSQFAATTLRKVIPSSKGYKYNYFAGADILGEVKVYMPQTNVTQVSYKSNGTTVSVTETIPAGYYNPSFYSALYGARFRGFHQYNNEGFIEEVVYTASGDVTFYSNAVSGFEREASTHYVDRYQCLGHPVANTYKLSYVLDGGTMSTAGPATATYDKAFSVVNPTRTGYEFQGWKITGMSASTHVIGGSNSTATSITTKATNFKNLTTTNNGTVTFTATWKDVTKPTVSVVLKTASGSTYTPSTWTKENVTATTTFADTNSLKTGVITQTAPTSKTLVSKTYSTNPTRSATESFTFTGTGKYSGTATDTDIAGLTASANFGPIWIDQTVPTGSVSYKLESDGTVTVTVTGKDSNSGLHSTPYSWDSGKTWTAIATKSVSQTASGSVLIRDAVGNQITVNYKVTQPGITYTLTNADGTTYTEGTWTGQNVKVSVTATDSNMKISNITINQTKPSEKVLVNKTVANANSGSASTTFSGTGEKAGTITAQNSIGITSNKSFGPIKIDQTAPTGSVSYNPATDTNKSVVVTVTASDAHSGLHATPYSWDNGKTWVNTKTYTVDSNSSGKVIIRDKVGNTYEVPWDVTWIDKISPKVTIEINGIEKAVGGEEKAASTGTYTGTWNTSKLNISISATDIQNTKYKATGIVSIELFKTNSTFAESSRTSLGSNKLSTPTALGKYADLDYVMDTEGTNYLSIVIKDAVGNVTQYNMTLKYDASGVSFDSTQSQISMVDISKMTDNQIRSTVENGTPLTSTFQFFLYDANTTSKKTGIKDSSGIKQVFLYLYDANYEANVSSYVAGYSGEGGLTSLLPATSGSLYDLTASRTGGENTTLSGNPYSGTYSASIDTFASFPSASGLRYLLIVYDYAGNRNIYRMADGDTLQNFSIKATIYSSVSDEYNIPTADGGNLPYLKTGDCGYVDVWTVGYVESISFDFLEVGNESAVAIKEGNLLAKYNLGTTDVPGYYREIGADKSTGLNGAYASQNGLSYANHYTYSAEGWLSDGVLIRIPPTMDLDPDLSSYTENEDATYIYQNHTARIYANKGGYSAITTAEYVLFSTSRFGIHHRVTYETPGTY